MPTNDERREVAARLRTVTRNDAEAVYLGDILSALVGGFTVTQENETDELLVINRLADLIEPEDRTCEKLNANSNDILPRCSECGSLIGCSVNYCQMCGAKVVG